MTPAPSVLIVEDHAHAREVAARFFRAAGWRVDEAADLPEALRLAAERGDGYGAAVVDLMLPGGSGVAVILAFRAAGLPARIVAWTACEAGSVQVAEAVAAGADAVLFKPCDMAEIIATAGGLLPGHVAIGTPDR